MPFIKRYDIVHAILPKAQLARLQVQSKYYSTSMNIPTTDMYFWKGDRMFFYNDVHPISNYITNKSH